MTDSSSAGLVMIPKQTMLQRVTHPNCYSVSQSHVWRTETDSCSVMNHESTFGLKFDSASILPPLDWRKNCLTLVTTSCLLQSLMSTSLKVTIIMNKMGLSWTNCICFSFTGLNKEETETKFCHSPRDVLHSDWRRLLYFRFAKEACGCVACQARRDVRLAQLVRV